jgi:hypothetical protein
MCLPEEQEDNNNKAKLRPELYVRTNAGKNMLLKKSESIHYSYK